MWFDVKYCAVVVRCGMYNALPLHLAPHHESFHILHCIIPHQTPTVFQSTPHCTSHHHSSQYYTFHITSTSRSTLFHFLIYFASRHISHCIPFYVLHYVPHNATFQITLYIGHISLPHPPHFTQFSCTAFRILHNCIIPPHP